MNWYVTLSMTRNDNGGKACTLLNCINESTVYTSIIYSPKSFPSLDITYTEVDTNEQKI